MSQPSSSSSLANFPLLKLQELSNDTSHVESQSPKAWFEKARFEAEKATIAERFNRPEELFVAYLKTVQYYTRTKSHTEYNDTRKKDPQWAARVKDFKESYEAFLGKARVLKDKLKEREVEKGSQPNGVEPSRPSGQDGNGRPTTSRQASGPDGGSLGSIADRMRLLQAKGVDTAPTQKRFSRDLHDAPPLVAPKPKADDLDARLAALRGLTVGAGNFGPSRLVAQKPPGAGADSRSRSNSDTAQPPSTYQRDSNAQSAFPSPSTLPPVSQSPTPFVPSPATSVRANATGSSSRRQSVQYDQGMPGIAGPSRQSPDPISPVHSGASQKITSETSQMPSLPEAPKQSPGQQSRPLPHPVNPPRPSPPEKAVSADNLNEFEKAFPSLSDFAKQYDDAPADGNFGFERDPDATEDPTKPHGMLNTHREDEEEGFTTTKLPDVSHLPGLPNLPSVPTSRPGLVGQDRDVDPQVYKSGPPEADSNADLKRPASTPNVATLSDSPNVDRKIPLPPAKAPLGPRENGSRNSQILSPPAMSFPVAKPTPGPSAITSGEKAKLVKPKFPFTNSIEPDTLRSYFLNPAVDVLVLDVRPEEEFQKGYVGREYEARAKIDLVWLDPNVILRDGLTSAKLEDALSLSPESHSRAFQQRNRYDVVVVYDSHSLGWPRKDAKSGDVPPLARLWEIIYEHEYDKRLERTPMLLTGGYSAWEEFIRGRAEYHKQAWKQAQANGHIKAHSPAIPNGHPPPPPPPSRGRERSGSAADSAKRANRDMPVYQSSHYAKNFSDNLGYAPQSMTGESSYTGRQRTYVSSPPPLPAQPGRNSSPSNSLSSFSSPIPAPPQASIHPGPGARRRSDYVEQHNQPYSGYQAPSSRPSIDYPQAHALAPNVPQPPPAAQSHVSERHDPRSAVVRSTSMRSLDQVASGGDEVRYWNDVVLGLTGLKNLGNTCYMNSTIQCLSATYPFTSYFLDGSFKRSINIHNPLGMKGKLASAFAELLKALWKEDYTFLSPVTFRKQIISFANQFSGTDQHDSQEFLSFVLDGLHEDLNRIQNKPPAIEMTPEREAALETLPPEVASEKEWQIYRMRNDSFIVDLFQGQYRNRLECLTCHKTSTTYDTFMYLSLPVPTNKSKVVVQELIDEFVKPELLDKEDAWNCPRCKVPRRATKTLTISRLPPVLLIQLKRFTTQNGVFWDKSETPVIFPIKGLDLTRYMPPRQPTGREDLDDPRTQIAPFRYDLYGVSNHMGTLSSGHYTAYVKSSKGWQYCEDSRVTKAQEKDVVSRPAYILFYKRIRV